jgi:hypothetical protein
VRPYLDAIRISRVPPFFTLALVIWVVAAFLLPAQQSMAGESPTELAAGLVAFDRAYIPVLALSNQNKPDAARLAMAILKEQWSSFSRQYREFYPEPDWRKGFDRTAAILARSEELLRNGDLPGAHAALEEVRDLWMGMRERRSIPYYIDFLNRYHESMEEVTGVAAGRTAATLEEARVRQVESLLPEARRRWEQTLAAPFDPALFGFSADKAEKLRQAEQAVLQGIGQAELALGSGDREALLRALEAMKPSFTKTFLMFGDFDRVGK